MEHASVMQATENTPPGSNPVKALYLQKDVQRLSAYFQVPLKHPSQFPVFTLTAMRALTALSMAGDETRVEAFSRALWQKLWQEDQDISKTEVLLEAFKIANFSQEETKLFVSIYLYFTLSLMTVMKLYVRSWQARSERET
eukprot:TRINITY_DN528_c0_g1_i3.p1 TRINITY_DN528_c0_g1~~TRINITY_DN528_c0_g1_i3.p1  ORF type:complete len:141 (+),score=25.66 TRINITY_DN528_c0_g1_i3:186-608(+)